MNLSSQTIEPASDEINYSRLISCSLSPRVLLRTSSYCRHPFAHQHISTFIPSRMRSIPGRDPDPGALSDEVQVVPVKGKGGRPPGLRTPEMTAFLDRLYPMYLAAARVNDKKKRATMKYIHASFKEEFSDEVRHWEVHKEDFKNVSGRFPQCELRLT